MHNNAQVGFHTNLVNNGTFNNNLGSVGFYHDNEIISVSGTNKPVFNDLEIDVTNNLQLFVSLGVTNELTFFNGKVITPKNNNSISLDFINHDFYVGEDDFRHVDGYASVFGNEEFIFPIGDDDRLRPMIIPNQQNNQYYRGAYFYENPETPSTFVNQFLTSQKQLSIENISNREFWDLDGNSATQVTLTWDSFSSITSISTNLDLLRVVGWSKIENQWVDLGNSNTQGNLNQGKITSAPFIPNNYTIITIGSSINNDLTKNENYLISPNGDNLNETLVIEEVERFEKNVLTIFNRWGNIVYKKENYKNDWNGISTGRITLDSESKLPVGTYFYTLKLGNSTNFTSLKKGWVYINR
ncbi:gliding motility-associated C-terminal domain-containing protein [Tenacibaculum sp. IB213877]|uniref:gliding motility-associated C-terminal domain-containing protein n=1 Tax=Tenacibaculum sp. IB213877 TaxID=3097351 RepID=UPI002A59B83F|nr:gliding motility-associated C-terminal domain-containing protein [Tenacibaculum sp. IB213877]MDY0779817.1 gliding motility-associated C-terminal domain-containing protein [Tenacibaculum sp. IB213877]